MTENMCTMKHDQYGQDARNIADIILHQPDYEDQVQGWVYYAKTKLMSAVLIAELDIYI